MSRTKKFIYNSTSNALMQIINIIIGFVIPRVMLRSYGSEINGLVSSITQFISYFSLVEAGLAESAIYSLYKPLADNDYSAVSAVVSAARRFYIKSGYIFIALTVGLAAIYPMFVITSKLSPAMVLLLVIVVGVSGALDFFTMAKYRVLLTADQKTYVITMISSITFIINALIIVILANYKVNIVALRTIALISILIRSIMLATYVKMKYKYINYKETPNNAALSKRWDALFLQVLYVVHVGTPVVIATIFTSLRMVSVYTIFNMVITGLSAVMGIFNSGLPASFGEIIVREEKTTLQRVYQEFEFSFYSIITVVFSIAFVIIMPFIRIYTKGINDANYDLPILGILFVVNGLLFNIKTPQGMLVISAGMYKETKWQTIIQGGIAIVAGAILAKFMGLPGMLIGYIMSNLYREIDLLFFVPKNVTKLKVTDTMYRQIRVFTAIFIIYIPFVFIKVTTQTYVELFIFAAIVGIYASIVVIIFGVIFDRQQLIKTLNRVLAMIPTKAKKVFKS